MYISPRFLQNMEREMNGYERLLCALAGLGWLMVLAYWVVVVTGG